MADKKTKRYYEKKIALWAIRGNELIKDASWSEAIEKAKGEIGKTIVSDKLRLRLTEAVLMSCEDGKKYPYPYLNVDFVSEREFYRQRGKFLAAVYDNIKNARA